MEVFNIEEIVNNMQEVFSAVVQSVYLGAVPDIQDFVNENEMDSYNSIANLRGDKIRTRIKKKADSLNQIRIIPYQRGSWQGYVIADDSHKILFSICSKQTLQWQRRRKKSSERKSPPYAPSFSFVLNGDMEAPFKQVTLADCYEGFDDIGGDLFTKEDYVAVFNDITNGRIDNAEEYHYAVITYEMLGMELVSVSLNFYDADMDSVLIRSLNEFLHPDYSSLTSPSGFIQEETEREPVYGLVSIKPGVKSVNEQEPAQEPVVSPKSEEDKQQTR